MHVGRKEEQFLKSSCDGKLLVQVKEYEYFIIVFYRNRRTDKKISNIVRKENWNSIYHTTKKEVCKRTEFQNLNIQILKFQNYQQVWSRKLDYPFKYVNRTTSAEVKFLRQIMGKRGEAVFKNETLRQNQFLDEVSGNEAVKVVGTCK